jgi:hypothetical protein
MSKLLAWFSASCFAIVVALPTGAYAQATRTWVSGVGDDVNPCSRTAPCKTFAGAPPPVWNTPFPLPWMTEFPNVTMAPVPLARTPVLLNSETRWSMKTPIPGFPAGTVAVTPALLF